MRLHNFKYQIILLGLSFLLSACVGGAISASPVTHHYLLTAVAQPAPANPEQEQITIELQPVILPHYLNRPQVVTHTSPNELQLAEFHHWGDNLKKNITRVMAENLARALPSERVAITPVRSAEPADYRIAINIQHFGQDSDGVVKLTVRWTLRRGQDRRVIEARLIELSGTTNNKDNFNQIVAQMSRLLGDLNQNIVDAIHQHTKSQP